LGQPFFLLEIKAIESLEFLSFKIKNLKFPGIKIPKIKLNKLRTPEISNRLIVFLTLFAALLTTTEVVLKLFNDLPSPEILEENNQILTTKIYDKSGV